MMTDNHDFEATMRAARCSCCGKAPACPDGDVNILTLDYVAAWPFPVWGNVLTGVAVKCAVGIACHECAASGEAKAREAIELRHGENFYDIVYHPVESLEPVKPPQPVQPREPDAEERVVFAIGRGAGGVTSLLLGVPAGAWEYMKDGKTHHLDLTRIGIPLQLILYGGKDHAACKQVIDEHNARQGVASVDMRGKDFGIKPNGGRDG